MTLNRIHIVTWRDLDDPLAGGSELHINELVKRWAASGLEITLRTGAVKGEATVVERDGYRVIRKGGRLTGLVRTPVSELLARQGPRDGLVEVWHGINFLSPLWARGPRVAFAHHVHGDQFRYVLPGPAARAAEVLETKISPWLYRTTPIATLSPSNRNELVALGHAADNVHVVPPGVDPACRPGGARSPHPLVVVVGRLMPQKRVDLVADALAPLRSTYPDLELVVVGDGPDRERMASVLPAWARLVGWASGEEKVSWYQRAWVVASGSVAEGWNMTLTEAGACGTPSIATDIAGHSDAVIDGVTGFLTSGIDAMTQAFERLLGDAELRSTMGEAARAHAACFTWDGAADALLGLLARQA
jgi:glycosyltransferase involved in cell wall biosynthesis